MLGSGDINEIVKSFSSLGESQQRRSELVLKAEKEKFVFETLFTEVLNEHAPLKQFHVQGNQVP